MAGEDVLPKYSLLYSKFNVLNEINNIKVNGEPISVEIKQKLYQDKFVSSRAKVTKKRIAEYLMSIGEFSGKIEITGIDDNVKSSLSSYHDFKRILEQGIISENDAERIIERITVTTDTKRLKKWLKENFVQLSNDDISYLSKLKYKDYGRLSRRFLEELYDVDPDSGEMLSESNIISRLWETNDNLMQLLSSKYKYSDSLESYNCDYYDQPENKKSLDERLKEIYLAPAVRCSVTRTLDIVNELKAILKRSPDKVFIEMARGEGETPKGKRTISRREQLNAFLAEIDANDRDALQNRLDNCEDGKLRSEKYFLYFMQLGKCAYTGKTISFEELEDNQKWNIDHIWPQAKIKDDSLENKVLVDSNANGSKGDRYPIDPEIRKKMSPFWKSLHEKKMMGDKKFNRLMRNTAFTEDELSGFIARQLVETRQSTKAVAAVLKELLPETDIVYVKAGLVSEFRQEMDMLKCREVNDLHHAKDAYLNIVMGNIYNTRFTKDPRNFVSKERNYSIKLTTLISKKIERNGEVAWDPSNSFDTVKKMMAKNSIRYVRYTYKRKGGLFNQMPERKKEGLVPRKQDLVAVKYGGYNNTSAAYFSLVKCLGGSIVIVPIELMVIKAIEDDLSFACKYVAEQLSDILSKNITEDMVSFPLKQRILKINTLLEIDGFRCNIVQKSNKGRQIVVSSAESLIIDPTSYNYVKKISAYLEKSEKGKKFEPSVYSGISHESNISLFDTLVDKMKNKPYNLFLSKIEKKISAKRDVFIKLSLTEQVLLLINMIKLLKTGRSTGCDLKLLGESGQAGVITINSDITKISGRKSINIIDQSPTGLFEKKSENLLDL
ncbi:CRISPR-associated endonuclease Csn1 [Ruminococcus albus]|uniref:CRISPR-associated endonuclease Csn1 n=1 Tax=Ruminococcus albus TaxID=1264 RepID=A0A1H7I2G4_RUMAL|nr:CRISPR-associated endonuclease Csn1 [Ruminococcus albus]